MSSYYSYPFTDEAGLGVPTLEAMGQFRPAQPGVNSQSNHQANHLHQPQAQLQPQLHQPQQHQLQQGLHQGQGLHQSPHPIPHQNLHVQHNHPKHSPQHGLQHGSLHNPLPHGHYYPYPSQYQAHPGPYTELDERGHYRVNSRLPPLVDLAQPPQQPVMYVPEYPMFPPYPYLNTNPSGYQYSQGMKRKTSIIDLSTNTTFKPTKPKKNSRPRINKINDLPKRLKRGKDPQSEYSLEFLCSHFEDVLKIEKPKDSGLFQLKLKTELECQLFDLFVHLLSNSIDIFLPQNVFKKIVPELALYDETNMITEAIFCLSSLMLQRIYPDKLEPSIPIKYYHRCIKSIRNYLSIPGVESNDGILSRCLLSTILLCIYEMFFVAIDATYVKGASSLLVSIIIKSEKKNLLKNSPFHEICFLGMFMCDLILSLKFNSPTMFSIENFWRPLDPEYFGSYDSNDFESNNEDEDNLAVSDEDDFESPEIKNISFSLVSKLSTLWWLHKTFINFSYINDYNNEVDVITKYDFETNKPFQKYLQLKKLIDDYETSFPASLNPIIYKPIDGDRLFPIIFFKDEITAIIGLNFKLSKVALYEALIAKNNTQNPLVIKELNMYPLNYAKKICKDIIGIIKTYDGNVNIWSTNIHTIRQVAKYIYDEPAEFEEFSQLVKKILTMCHLNLQQTII